jgi:uncharacterized Zn finger protein
MATTTGSQRWSQHWVSTLRALDRLATRPTASTTSRIRRMEVSAGQVTAEVQDRTHGICQVVLEFAPLSEGAWRHVLTIFEKQLAGAPLIEPRQAFPESDPALREFCALLFPDRPQDMRSSCSCCKNEPRDQNCPALQTVYRQLGAMLDEEPVLLLRLRGREWQQVVQALQKLRSDEYGRTSPAAAAGARLTARPDGGSGSEGTPASDLLTNQLGNFWGSRKQMESVQHYIAAPTIDLAILRRLGPLPDELSDPEVDQQLARLYRFISRKAEALAYDLDNGGEADDGA